MNTQRSIENRKRRLAQPKRARLTNRPNDERAATIVPPIHPAESFPNPWQFDTRALIAELDRAREIILAIPLSNATFGPVNTATATLWELRERLRYLANAVSEGQRRWNRSRVTVVEPERVTHGEIPETRPRAQGSETRRHAAAS